MNQLKEKCIYDKLIEDLLLVDLEALIISKIVSTDLPAVVGSQDKNYKTIPWSMSEVEFIRIIENLKYYKVRNQSGSHKLFRRDSPRHSFSVQPIHTKDKKPVITKPIICKFLKESGIDLQEFKSHLM